ncbi:MAG: VOC family protein, partial [Brooklawnia sp.]|nr:VOC family protein [Brooklawnia sp.]
DSIDDVLAQVTELGGTVTLPKGEIDPTSWYAVFTDPDGNQIGLFESTHAG